MRTLLGAAGGHLSPSWVDLGEAVVGFVGKYLGTADCEVARNRATGWFKGQQHPRVYYAITVLVSLCPRRFSRWFSLSTVQRAVSLRQLSCTPPPRSAWRSRATFGGTAHQKGFLWGFREVGVALIPLTCVTAPGSPRLSSLSV